MNSRLNIVNEFVGSTLRTTWINSGSSPGLISSALYGPDNSLVSSASQTSSGNGHFYCDIALPMSKQWMLNEQIAVIETNTYRRFQLVHVQQPRIST